MLIQRSFSSSACHGVHPRLLASKLRRWRMLEFWPGRAYVRWAVAFPAVLLFHERSAVGSEIDDRPVGTSRWIEKVLFPFVEVLTRVCRLIFEYLNEFVETGREQSTKDRAKPVYLCAWLANGLHGALGPTQS